MEHDYIFIWQDYVTQKADNIDKAFHFSHIGMSELTVTIISFLESNEIFWNDFISSFEYYGRNFMQQLQKFRLENFSF
jgi:hypothetical protein